MSSTADRRSTQASTPSWDEVRNYLVTHGEHLRRDAALLRELGLRPAPGNVVEFAPPTVTRLEGDLKREIAARKAIEAVAEANFKTQAQIQSAVLDLLESRSHTDLSRRVEESARRYFDLATATLALEGPQRVPVGWKALPQGCVDDLIGRGRVARLGPVVGLEALFPSAANVKSVALVRMSLWEPARPALMAYGSADPEHFTPGMGLELVAYLARVVERTTERWPVL
jgi:uncharacterized protein